MPLQACGTIREVHLEQADSGEVPLTSIVHGSGLRVYKTSSPKFTLSGLLSAGLRTCSVIEPGAPVMV